MTGLYQSTVRILSRDEVPGAEPSLQRIAAIGVGAGALHGFAMGVYAWIGRGGEGFLQCLAGMLKVPLLFVFTGVVTFPSLLVFSQLLSVPLQLRQALRIAVAAAALTCVVLASLSPVVVFFSLNTRSYPFLLLLNVLFFAVAGAIGSKRLLQDLRAVAARGAGTRSRRSGVFLLEVWAVLTAFVGCQASWTMRPFVLAPDADFVLFCERGSNFFAGLWRAVADLLDGV